MPDRYRSALEVAGFDVREFSTEYSAVLEVDEIVGGMYSAMAPGQLPARDRRDAFGSQLAEALRDEPFVEIVRVAALIARL